MINVGFFFYYLGPATFLLYPLCLLRALPVKLGFCDILLIISIVILTVYKAYFNAPLGLIMATRFFFGFIAIYLFFKTGQELAIDKVLLWLAIVTIADAILVNTILSPQVMPNYADAFQNTTHLAHATNFFGFYQRPFSFGGSPSVTSALLVTLLALRRDKQDKILFGISLIAIAMCLSGSGFIALLVYTYFRKKSIAYACIGGFAFIAIMYGLVGHGTTLVKISPWYFSILLDQKMGLISSYIESQTVHDFMFGTPGIIENYGGDFALWSMVKVEGVIGTLLFFLFVLNSVNRYNYQALVIILIAAVHYATFAFFPGQIIFAYALTRNQQNSFV